MKKNYFLPVAALIAFFLPLFSSPLFAEEGSSPGNAQTDVASNEPLFDNQEAVLHYKEGVNRYKKRNYSKAIDELEKAVELNPDFKEAYYLLGYAYYKTGKMDLSREAFDQAYELDPKYSPLPPK